MNAVQNASQPQASSEEAYPQADRPRIAPRTIEILGMPVVAATTAQMIGRIQFAARSTRIRLAYVNAHTLNLACRNPKLREALLNCDFVLNDGAGVSLAARLQGRRFPNNLHGSAFNTRILELAASERWSVFLLGGRPGIPERAAAELRQQIPHLQIAGARHGFHHHPARDVAAVNTSGASVLLVAMGNPRQELWLEQHFHQLPGIRIAAGVGAYLDFQAKVVRRAPEWMNRCGIEWLYRLAQEPLRLGKRYIVGNPYFLFRVVRAQMTAGRRP
ncbi:MAG TPA: WecB/TagA/CpsF family glycosyltransferase [Solirubrobacteraceae bacterium]|jgi:exopolysaccharide biosynthesis WecB/TagA/CpsF family protein|nr:WecB/TagA/CpsF family glycosyltransferase [Solirubrobacteraceae bacterium]